jgi:ABC-2 type transport system ATP-binding protein
VEICGHRLPEGRSEALEQVGFSAGYVPLAERLRVAEFLAMYAQFSAVENALPRIEAHLERFRISHLMNKMSTTCPRVSALSSGSSRPPAPAASAGSR